MKISAKQMSLSANHFTCTCSFFFLSFFCSFFCVLLLFDLTLQVTHKQPQRALNQKVRAQLCALVKRKKRSEIKAKLFVPSIYSGDTFTGCFGSRFSSSLLYSFVLFFVLLFFYISSHDFSSKLPLPSSFFFLSPCLSRDSLFIIIFFLFVGLFFFSDIFILRSPVCLEGPLPQVSHTLLNAQTHTNPALLIQTSTLSF